MAEIIYPDGLPNPSLSMTFTPAERRFMNGLPLAIRAFERGFRGNAKVHFQYTAGQAAIFRPWWETDLNFGTNWFAANWPNAFGFTFKVYRFKPNTMTWAYNGFEYYIIEAECYVRGLSLHPVGP